MEILILLVVVVVLLFAVPDIRRSIITRPAFAFFKRVLPPLSATEREAMEAGDTWWDGDLFSGRPDWHKFHQIKAPEFTAEEQSFIANQLETLLAMLDDFKIVHQDMDLPK